MDPTKIDVELACQSGFSSLQADGNCHIKALPYLSVVQAVEGSYDIRLADGDMYNTGAGGFFIAPADVNQTIIHHADQASGRMVCRWVFMKIRLNDSHRFEDLYDLPVILPGAYVPTMNALFDRLFSSDTRFDHYVVYYEIIRLLSQVSQPKPRKNPSQLEAVLTYIKNHYREPLTIHELAQTANLSDSHFFSVFKKAMGISPIAYVNRYRSAIAAELLLSSDMTITEIADSVGIGDPVYFNKFFKKLYQLSPGTYRKIYTSDNG